MGPLLVDACRYNRWANLYLFDVCSKLDEGQLALTAAGTYGTVADTFVHLVGAEQRYIRRLTGAEPTVSEKNPFPGLALLTRAAESSGDVLIELATKVQADQDIHDRKPGGYDRLLAGVVFVQALHHGNDHRTHICTILGSHDIEYGDMDVWAYGRSIGAAVPSAAG